MKDELQKYLKDIKEKLIPGLQSIFGDNLVSVILYGSAVKGTYIAGSSDINLLLLLEKPEADKLIQFGKNSGKLMRKERVSVQILTCTEFLSSSDVFPMEHMDIHEDRQVLFGKDVAADLNITLKNLRHQVEERLRGNITAFRQGLINSRGDKKYLALFLSEWAGAQNALFRGLLRLKKVDSIPTDSSELIKSVGKSFELDPKGMLELNEIREGEKGDVIQAADHALIFLTELASKVDRLDEYR